MEKVTMSALALLLILFISNIYGNRMYIERDIIPSYYGYSYDINWDGHDAYLYSYISDFDTSTSYPIMIGTDYDGYNEWGRGHVQYDLSSIPSDATILSVGMEFYVGYVGQWDDEWDSHHSARVKIYSMWRNQADYSPHNGDVYTYDLFDDADDGTLFGTTGAIVMDSQFDEYYPSDTSWFDLGPACVDTVQSRIASGINWIGFGFTHYDPNEDLDEGVDLFGKLTKLHIVYQPADAPILINPSVLPDSGDTNTFFKYSIDYIDSTGYEPDTALVIIDDSLDFPLILTSGSATNGTYSVKSTLRDTGLHDYYFRFVNSYGNIVVYPTNAPGVTLSGPYVGENLGIVNNNQARIALSWFERNEHLYINSEIPVHSVDVYSIDGACIFKHDYDKKDINFSLKGLNRKILLCSVKLANGKKKIIKYVNIK